MKPELFLGKKGISGSQYLGQGSDTLLSLLKEYHDILLTKEVTEGHRPKYPTLEYIVLSEKYDDLLENCRGDEIPYDELEQRYIKLAEAYEKLSLKDKKK